MPHHNTAFQQLLKPISRHEFEKLAKSHHRGQKLRSVSRWDQFTGMVLAQLCGRQSLRDIEVNLQSQSHKLYHQGSKPIAKSSLARVNERQPHGLYEALFYQLLGRFQGGAGHHRFRFKNPLYSLDASLIELSLKIFPWAKYNRDKGAIKLHVGLNHGNLLPEFVALDDANIHEINIARRFDFPRGSIVVMDRGYTDYGFYKSLSDKGVFFVTRQRSNAVFEVREERQVGQQGSIIHDQRIELTSRKARTQQAPLLRRIVYVEPDTGKQYTFITNHFDLAAQTIADIYKARWQVELLFKSLKQNLKIKSFVGTSKNAILTQIWIALCTYLLVAYLRFTSKSGWSIKRLIGLVGVNLFERRCIYKLANPPPVLPTKQSPQLGLSL